MKFIHKIYHKISYIHTHTHRQRRESLFQHYIQCMRGTHTAHVQKHSQRPESAWHAFAWDSGRHTHPHTHTHARAHLPITSLVAYLLYDVAFSMIAPCFTICFYYFFALGLCIRTERTQSTAPEIVHAMSMLYNSQPANAVQFIHNFCARSSGSLHWQRSLRRLQSIICAPRLAKFIRLHSLAWFRSRLHEFLMNE